MNVTRFFGEPSSVICAYLGEGEVVALAATDSQRLVEWTQSRTVDEVEGSWAGISTLKNMSEQLLDFLKSELGYDFKAGVGRYHPGLAGLAHSYSDAHDALRIGRTHDTENRVYSLDTLGIISFVSEAGEGVKRELADQLLLPLRDEPDLLYTLDVYLALDCRTEATVDRLFIHRNTLRYRLDRIAALTGLDPRNFNEAIQLRLARLLQTRNR